MRTFLLILLALTIGGSGMAQKRPTGNQPFDNKKNIEWKQNRTIESATPYVGVPSIAPKKNMFKGNSSVDTIFIGASINAFTLLLQQQTCLTYNKDVNTIMGTFRGNNYGSYGKLGTGNDICNYFSTDGGASWIGKDVLVGSSSTAHRYPSGVIYNPSGNTTIDNIYTVVAGPRTDGSNWTHNYFSSTKYDLTNTNTQYVPTGANHELIREGLTATTDGKFHIGTMDYNTSYTSMTMFTRWGEWNNSTNSIDWNIVNFVPDVSKATDGTYNAYFGLSNMAWSKDGSIGYVGIIASDNRPTPKGSYSPMLWKSTDGGATWNALDYFDFGTLQCVKDWILPIGSDTSVYRPYFSEFDVVVDANSKPHVFGLVRGSYSENIDSLNYIWTRNGYAPDNNIMEFWQDENDAWHGIRIDSIKTDDVTTDISPYTSSSGNVGWDHRMQASTTDDHTKVFVTWTDSDWQFWGTTKNNLNPDLYAWGRDIYTYQNTDIVNMTYMSSIWGAAFFNFTSKVTMDNAGVYNIPVTIENIDANGKNADLPPYHYFLKGVEFSDLDFALGTNDKPKTDNKTVQCYPNPFTGTTSVIVSLDKSCPVSLDIFNITGQKVSSTSFGTMNAGTQTLTVDGSKLSSGVYFFTVRLGDESRTGKMVVK